MLEVIDIETGICKMLDTKGPDRKPSSDSTGIFSGLLDVAPSDGEVTNGQKIKPAPKSRTNWAEVARGPATARAVSANRTPFDHKKAKGKKATDKYALEIESQTNAFSAAVEAHNTRERELQRKLDEATKELAQEKQEKQQVANNVAKLKEGLHCAEKELKTARNKHLTQQQREASRHNRDAKKARLLRARVIAAQWQRAGYRVLADRRIEKLTDLALVRVKRATWRTRLALSILAATIVVAMIAVLFFFLTPLLATLAIVCTAYLLWTARQVFWNHAVPALIRRVLTKFIDTLLQKYDNLDPMTFFVGLFVLSSTAYALIKIAAWALMVTSIVLLAVSVASTYNLCDLSPDERHDALAQLGAGRWLSLCTGRSSIFPDNPALVGSATDRK